METSYFLAQTLAIGYLSIGLGILVSADYYRKELSKIMEQPGFLLLGGFISLIIGALMVSMHNIWYPDWTLMITIVGWGAVIKGMWLIIFPGSLKQFRGLFQAKNMTTVGVTLIIIGMIFGYFGFLKL